MSTRGMRNSVLFYRSSWRASSARRANLAFATLGCSSNAEEFSGAKHEVNNRRARSTAQVWGGTGYCKPNVAERLCRDQHILEVYERTSEIQRVMIAVINP